MEGTWLSILEYAQYKKKSVSTIRRYIKANRVKFRDEEGKYFIWTPNYVPPFEANKRLATIELENERLKSEVCFLEEEISELKMLIAAYELESLPALPKLDDELPPPLPV